MISVLLRNQWTILKNTFRSQGWKGYGGYLVAIIILGVLLYFISKGIWALADSISGPILAGIFGYGQLVMITFILLIGLPQVFKNLYAATDLELLFTLPIPTRHIFWMKYVESFAGIPLFCFVFLLFPLVVYGIAVHASLLFYPVLIVADLAIIMIGLSLVYLLNLGLMQLIPANRANELMTVMSGLSGLFGYLLVMLPNIASDKGLAEMLLAGMPLFPKWVPVSWGSDALIAAANGSVGFLLPLVLLVILAALLMLVASSLVEKGFRTGWIRLSEGNTKKKRKRTKKAAVSHKPYHPATAVGIKEWFVIKRDIREWLVFMPLAFFIIFPLIGFFSSGASLSDLKGHNQISWPIAQAAFLFVYAMFNGTVAATSIAREGASVWILRTLPLSGRSIALGKLWISWLLPFIMLTVLEIILGLLLGWTLLQFVLGITVKAVLTTGISAIGLWLGTIGAKYNPKNPQARLKFWTSIIMLVLSYAYLLIAFIPYILLIMPIDAVELVADARSHIGGFLGVVASCIFTLLKWRASSPVLMGIVGGLVSLLIPLGIATLFMLISARKIEKGITIEKVHENQSKLAFGKSSGKSLY
ncbi:putative ABC transporter permease subunit [Lentibacillus songyuanensis]|uniref:putative ABC transporter permease subunit n=1 Tax=Lentibacillus songyuanensis TaxID=3136161 RepID=UPI0031B9ADC3